jgi:serine protein kinase
MEDTIERIVSYFKHAAQGLEEKRQILYLLGPVGGGKSSLAERLKELMEKRPIYVLKAEQADQPGVRKSARPFRSADLAALLKTNTDRASPLDRCDEPVGGEALDEFNGDISKFEVARIYPSKLRQIAIAKTEPGDDNNQDISALVGKVDIRKLEHFSQNDPDAYAFSAACATPIRASSNSSRCSRPRSKCCIRC